MDHLLILIKIFIVWFFLFLLYKKSGLILALLLPATIYFSLVGEFVGSGDAAAYNTLIESNSIHLMPIHLGYLVFGLGVGHIIPLSTDYAMNLAQVITALCSVALVYDLFKIFTNNKHLSSLIALAFGSSIYVVYNAIFSEIYLFQAFLALFSFWLYFIPKQLQESVFAKNQRSQTPSDYSILGGLQSLTLGLFSGLVFGFSLTVSVANVALLPLFFLPGASKEKIVRCFIGIVLSFGVFLVFYWEGFFFGTGYRALFSSYVLDDISSRVSKLDGWLQSIKILFGTQPALFPLFLMIVYQQIKNREWELQWTLPCFASLILHLFLGGVFLQWGFDLIVLPLFFIPFALYFQKQQQLSIFVIAILLNTFSGLWIWLNRPLFQDPAKFANVYAKMEERFGPVIPLGYFDSTGFYLRANHKPFDYRQDPFDTKKTYFKEGEPGKYLILDKGLISYLNATNVKKVSVNGVEAWVWDYTALPGS